LSLPDALPILTQRQREQRVRRQQCEGCLGGDSQDHRATRVLTVVALPGAPGEVARARLLTGTLHERPQSRSLPKNRPLLGAGRPASHALGTEFYATALTFCSLLSGRPRLRHTPPP